MFRNVTSDDLDSRVRSAQPPSLSPSADVAAEASRVQVGGSKAPAAEASELAKTSYAAASVIQADIDWLADIRLENTASHIPITRLSQKDLEYVLGAIPSREESQRHLLLFMRNVLPVLPVCQAGALGTVFSNFLSKPPEGKFYTCEKMLLTLSLCDLRVAVAVLKQCR